MSLTIARYQRTLEAFNYTPSWDLPRWGNATAGELGEMLEAFGRILKVCNTIKKIDRQNRGALSLDEARTALADEISDVIGYATHLASAAGIELEDAMMAKFNSVAAKNGSMLRLSKDP